MITQENVIFATKPLYTQQMEQFAKFVMFHSVNHALISIPVINVCRNTGQTQVKHNVSLKRFAHSLKFSMDKFVLAQPILMPQIVNLALKIVNSVLH